MDDDKKYYWLRLKKDFFKRHDIRIIEDMPNGKDYVLFYLKLLCESVDHEGNLRFSEQIPYNEQMLSTITNTNVDIVRSAIKVFTELQLMEILDDKTIYMSEVNKMMGFETKWAEKKREYRERLKGQCPNDVLPMSDNSKRIELEIEKEIDIDIKKENKEKKDLQTFLDELQILFGKPLSCDNGNLATKIYEILGYDNGLYEIKNNIDKRYPIAYTYKVLMNKPLQEEDKGSAWLDNFNKQWEGK